MTRNVFWIIAILIFAEPVMAFSAEFGQGGMSVIPAPLTPSIVAPPPPPPQPSASPPASLPSPSVSPPVLPGFQGITGVMPLTTKSRLIVLTNPPGAKVFLGGFFLGMTPLNTLLYAGNNAMLEITEDGYYPENLSVLLAPGKTVNVQFSMKKITGINP